MELHRLEVSDAEELFALIDANRAYLRQWLPWLDRTQEVQDVRSFIAGTIEQYTSGRGPQFKILNNAKVVGVIGFHPIDRQNQTVEIGYWLAANQQGSGIITKCCSALLELAFEEFGLNRVQIPASEFNQRSRAVPERLGFKFEGIIRARENLYGQYFDHAMYSLLRDEYKSEES